MYQAWPWGGTPNATAAGFAAPAAAASAGQVAQWPAAAYGQYAAMTPEMQQQWAAAWATQAQYAYGAAVPVAGQATNTAYPGYTEAQPADSKNETPSEQPKNSSAEPFHPSRVSSRLYPRPDPHVAKGSFRRQWQKPKTDKLKQLKEQAEQWKSLQQPAAAASWNYSAASGETAAIAGTSAESSQLDAEEEEFEKQFSEWEGQFEAWKEQNQGHPDKEAFAQYEKQWQEWRATLLLKKEQMQKAKAERAAAAAAAATNTTPTPTTTAVDAASMYYQQQQYMYMQPYMFPQGPPMQQPPYPAGEGMYPPNAPQDNPNAPAAAPNPKETGNFEAGQRGPQNEFQQYDGNAYPPDAEEQQRYPNEFGGRGRGRGGRWSQSNNVDPEMRPGLLDNPPDFPPEGDYNPERDGFNPGPPFDFPPDEFGEGGPPRRTPLLGTTPSMRDHQGPPPLPSNRYPPDDFDDGPPFPPEGGYGGRPPFPPRGGFHPRGGGGRRFPPDFDRFGGPPHFPGDGPPFGPPPHDDRFPFPGERPPRMRGGGGHFGPPRGGRFPPEDPFFREGGPHFKDYTHRTADDFDPHYDYENDYHEDVMHYRDNFTSELSTSASDPLVFSKAAVETFDYGHGLKPVPSGPTVDPLPPVKVFNYAHCGSAAFQDRDPFLEPEFPLEREYGSRNFRDHPGPDHRDFKGRDGDFKGRDGDFRGRDGDFKGRDMDFKGRDGDFRGREGDFKGRDMDFKGRDGDFRGREGDFKGRDGDFRGREGDFKGRDGDFRGREGDFKGRDSRESDFKGRDSRESDFKGRDNDFKGRDGDFRGRDSDFKGWDSDFKGRDSRDGDFEGRDSREGNFKGRNFREGDFKGRDSREGDFKGSRDVDFKDRDSREGDSKRGGGRRHEDERPEKRPRWEEERNGSRDKPGQKDGLEVKRKKGEEVTLVEDLLSPPQRTTRPKQMVVVLRGLPGSGKTYVAKLIKDKEVENGGSAPRILSLDDYFMTEVEVNDIDPDTGKKVKRKEFKFEYEVEMEETYRSSLFKSFKKTIDDRFFPFIVVDAVHARSSHYHHYWSYAKQKGFQVYVAEMECKDPSVCFKRNTHSRSLEDITKILQTWEPKPSHFMALDVRSLLQDVAITEVEMEVETKKVEEEEELDADSGSNDADDAASVPSRWEKLEATEEKLDQLDGLRTSKGSKGSSMEDYLQLPDDYEDRKCEPGKKRVRWADLEERKEQDRLRAIGFVVGQTDWNKMTDPSHADRALTKTKFF